MESMRAERKRGGTMIRIFRTMEDTIQQVEEGYEGCWIALTNPTAAELLDVMSTYQIDLDHLRAPLDEEERSRIEVEENYTMIIVDIPVTEERKEKEYYVTIPCGIIITKDNILTICLEDTPILEGFMDGRVRNFWTYRKTRFFLQILNRNAAMYLQYLRMIDKKSDEVEKKLHISTKNQELIELLELEKSLVYFTTSLRSNEVVLERMLKIEAIKKYPEDEELLGDVIIENKQAIEMADIYSNILSGTMDAYASVISNNLNIVMKVLAVITIIMSIPTMIASFWGMNVPVPLEDNPHGFAILLLLSAVLTIAGYLILSKKKMF
jgi:magnesium transporter